VRTFSSLRANKVHEGLRKIVEATEILSAFGGLRMTLSLLGQYRGTSK